MKITHVDENGNAHMVDVAKKTPTHREAYGRAIVTMKEETLELILQDKIAKGNVFACARIAGIMAAKKTFELIPMCHQIPISSVDIEIKPISKTVVEIISRASCFYVTGIEMEALSSASICALTIYDMCKAVDKSMEISEISLLKKTGGKSGTYLSERIKDEGGSI